MKWRFAPLGFGLSALVSSIAFGYETQTHAYLSYQGFQNSDLNNANSTALLQRLGLDRLDAPQPFSPYWLALPFPEDFYFDNVPSGASPLQYERPATTYEWAQMQQLVNVGAMSSTTIGATPIQTLPIVNWVMRGAIREDDLAQDQYDPRNGAPPDPDPYGPFNRVYNHFYDPINNRRFTYTATPLVQCPTFLPESGGFCYKSVDWAMGTVDAFNSLAPDPNRHQHFSWADARNNFFLALVAERDANASGVREAAEREADAEERLFRWASTFRALGDVMHLLQDAAQPQHTRNDRHDPDVAPPDQQGFEPFTNARLIGVAAASGTATLSGGQVYVRGLSGNPIVEPFLSPLPDINGYPVPAFATALRFFTTRAPGDGPDVSPDSRIGIADYSNKGFFTRGTTPGSNTALPGVFAYNEPDPTLTGFSPQTSNCALLPGLRGRDIKCTTYSHTVPDPLQPARSDVTTAQPLVADGMWKGFLGSTNQYTLTPQVYQVTGNLTVPRAIAYSAGIVNYFFRGKLSVTAPPDKVVAVLNQGAQHTMNTQGYPCVGTASNDGCTIFGFQSVRVSVQNTTPSITESGTGGATVAQNLSATLAGSVSDPNFSGPYLVAVAKYHRNTCYKPDLSGEPFQIFNFTPPSTGITQPTCSVGQTTRTPYQEISVSKSAIATAAQLANNAAPFEVHFDFSADPIPVNATDLFIQVVYRGPMGNAATFQEPDAIAVGTLDVREPTFASFWNNTDYYNNAGTWAAHNSLNPNEGVRDFWACAGGAPVKLVYEYFGTGGPAAMVDPIDSSNVPGQVRLAVVYSPPEFVGQGKSLRGVPVTFPGIPGTKQIPLRSPTVGTGQFRQANLENISTSTLNLPIATCAAALPVTAQYWCFDPIQKRRNQLMGTPDQPLYLDNVIGSNPPPDVDANATPAPLPAFAGTVPLALGTIRFDTDTTLASCPTQPTGAAPTSDEEAYVRYLDLLEEARDLGVSAEDEQPTQQNR
jgi:hypothetical protein